MGLGVRGGLLASEPLAQVQYVSRADYDTLEELDAVKGKNPALDGGVHRQDKAHR